jgi:transposase-like protein
MTASGTCRKLGISEQTLYRWKAKYGGDLLAKRGPRITREAPLRGLLGSSF